MEPALTAQELAKLYPHLTPEQRIELERWHRGRTHDRMTDVAVDENAQPPYPEYPPGSLVDQAIKRASAQHFDPEVVVGLRRLHDEAIDLEQQFIIGRLVESQRVLATRAEQFELINKYWDEEGH